MDSDIFKKIFDEEIEDLKGWIVLDVISTFTPERKFLESIPEAWCGVKFDIAIIPFGLKTLILGSKRLDQYPIDREFLVDSIRGLIPVDPECHWTTLFKYFEEVDRKPKNITFTADNFARYEI